MAHYYLHLRDSVDELLDPDGQEYADLEALKKAVMFCARDVIAGDLRNGVIDLRYRIDAENTAGEIVYTLPFKHAFNVIPEDANPGT
jgi:hypothetical protein